MTEKIRWHQESIYQGSVQYLYQVSNQPDRLISQISDAGSVFDIGAIFSLTGASVSRTAVRALVFEALADPVAWQRTKILHTNPSGSPADYIANYTTLLKQLSAEGANTHHKGMIAPDGMLYERLPERVHWSPNTLIERFPVTAPVHQVWQTHRWYDYSECALQTRRMIPLEYIVRLGLLPSSSLLKHYTQLDTNARHAMRMRLGLKAVYSGVHFASPLVECTTKREVIDRRLDLQEASLIAALNGELFARSLDLAACATILVESILAQVGLQLWDGKWEFAVSSRQLYFADTFDTDSMRITVTVQYADKQFLIHYNKQAIRDYYILCHTDWYTDVLDAQQKAVASAEAVSKVLANGQAAGHYAPTPKIDPPFAEIQARKLDAMNQVVAAFIDQGWQLSTATQKECRAMLHTIARDEIAYFYATPNFAAFSRLAIVDERPV